MGWNIMIDSWDWFVIVRGSILQTLLHKVCCQMLKMAYMFQGKTRKLCTTLSCTRPSFESKGIRRRSNITSKVMNHNMCSWSHVDNFKGNSFHVVINFQLVVTYKEENKKTCRCFHTGLKGTLNNLMSLLWLSPSYQISIIRETDLYTNKSQMVSEKRKRKSPLVL